MEIITNREVEIFDEAYRLGYHAGQLAWRRHMVEGRYRIEAEMTGVNIAMTRGNISLEEYILTESREED